MRIKSRARYSMLLKGGSTPQRARPCRDAGIGRQWPSPYLLSAYQSYFRGADDGLVTRPLAAHARFRELRGNACVPPGRTAVSGALEVACGCSTTRNARRRAVIRAARDLPPRYLGWPWTLADECGRETTHFCSVWSWNAGRKEPKIARSVCDGGSLVGSAKNARAPSGQPPALGSPQ
jgi:hypothetical protein